MRLFNPRGSAIFLALIMMVGALAILMGVLASSTNNVVKHDQYTGREATYFAAEGVISQAWGHMYDPIARQTYTDAGIFGYFTGADTNSPYRGSFAMPVNLGDPNDINTTSDSSMESAWVALPNLDVPTGNPIIPYTNAGFKFGNSTIVDLVARWRRDVKNTGSANGKLVIWTVTLRATAQNKIDPNKPGWYDETDPPAVVAQTFQFTQQHSSSILNYVNLARNVSCTLCHTQFQDVINAFNNDAIAKITDPSNSNTTAASTTMANALKAQYGTFDKVKLGTLGNFQVRDLNTVDTSLNGRFYPSDSLLDGTLYSRGIVQDNDHNALSIIRPEAMQARQFDATNPTKIAQDTSGNETPVSMANAGYATDGNPLPNANLYLNYPNSSTVNTVSGGTMKQTDGDMPDDFPYPFDPNVPSTLPGYTAAQLDASQTNRLVDGPKVDNWVKMRTDPVATADAGNPNRLGALSGGLAMVVDATGNIISAPKVAGVYQTITNDTKLPNAAMVAGNPVDTRLNPSQSSAVGGASGIVNGNLILVGTKDNPVNLANQVLVKGDVIIKGYYTGVGSVWATGNIYLPSDLRYGDAALKDAGGNPILDKTGMPVEDFGNLKGGGQENLGGMIAGGTIVIGDYLTSSLSAAPTTSAYTQNLPPDTGGVRENSFPLVPTYQKADPNFTYNYRDLNTSTGTYNVSNQSLYAKNFTLSQMELFNRDEWGHTQPVLPNGTSGAYDVPNAQYGQFDPVKGTYDSTKPYMPRYYVLNPGDPVGAFVYGSQSTNPSQMAVDAANRLGTEGSYWSNGTATEPPMWKGGEMSKVYNTTTVGGDASQAGAGSIVNGTATNLVYGAGNSTLVSSTDPSATQKAAVVAINPQWLGATPDKSTATMWSMLLNEEWDRKFNTPTSQAVYASTNDPSPSASARDGQPFRLDGLFYTNNAIFGIQRNRSLAPQAPGDYSDKSGPITTGPQAPDPTKAGPWPTPVPDVTYQYDNYQGNVVYDTYSATLYTDHYRRTPYTDNYTQPVYTDNYTQPASYDTYSQTPYTDNYQQTQYYDTYSQTPLTDHYTQTQNRDQYTRTPYTDVFSRPMYTDIYVRTPYTDNYSRTPYTDNYTQPVSTVTWTLFTGSGYSRLGPFTVTQVSPPGTISQPTTAGSPAQAVTQATSSTAMSANTSTSSVYYVQASPPSVPAGYTKTGTTAGTVQTSASAVYYTAGTPPSVPAGYTKTGTSTGAAQTSASSQYAAGAQPAVPATYTLQSTSSTVVTSASSVYYVSTAHPSVPSGFTYTSTTTGSATTAQSAIYVPPAAAPTPPAGYTVTGTTTTTATSLSTVYYAPSTGPTPPAGWTKASTTTGTVTTSKSANYTTTPPTPPANSVKTGTVTTTANSTSAVYYNLASPPSVPSGWTKISTTTGTTVTSKSANYTTSAPSVPTNFTKTGTVSTTNTSVSTAYYNLAAPPSVPTGFTKASTSTTNNTTSSTVYYDTLNPPTVPTGYTKTSTSTGAVNTVASAAYRTGSRPALPGGYSMDVTGYGPTGTTSATTTTKTANYMQGTTPPAPPSGYIASDKTATVPGSPATATIQVPYGSAAPAGYPTKLAPTNPTYAYPATTAGTNAKDFKKYAKEMTSSSQGVMVVNGALVAPDLGLLVTGRSNAAHSKTLIMNYDARVRRLVQFSSNTPDFKWSLVMKGWTRLTPPAAIY